MNTLPKCIFWGSVFIERVNFNQEKVFKGNIDSFLYVLNYPLQQCIKLIDLQ